MQSYSSYAMHFFLVYIYPHMKFHGNISYTLRVMLQTKFKYKIKQRAITQKLRHAELQFLCTALLLYNIYQPMKFQQYLLYCRSYASDKI